MPKKDDRPNYRKVLEGVSRETGRGMMDVFRAWVTLCACAMSCGAREAEYMEEIKRWDKPHAEAFAVALGHLQLQMSLKPWEDLLGDTFQENLSASRAMQMGQFFTPTELCRLMARMTLDRRTFEEGRVVEILEPTSGSGRGILAAWEAMEEMGLPATCARATCWDLDPLAADMTVVNLSLSGIPAVVVQGNSLSQKIDKTTYTPFWRLATPFVPQEAKAEEEPQAEPEEDSRPTLVALEDPDPRGQYEMDFQEAA